MYDLWEVTVSNIGMVYSGTDEAQARSDFAQYKTMSEKGYGRVANENVTLWKTGQPIEEYEPRRIEED